MPRLLKSLPVCIAIAAAVTYLGSAPSLGAAQESPVHYAATAVNMLSTSPGGAAIPINIVVTRWTPRAEQEQILSVLLEQGERAFVEALRKLPPTGSIAGAGSVGFDIRYATITKLPNGTDRVVAITDRPMSFAERWDGGRTTDYAVTYLDMTLNPSGRGQGQVVAAARILPDPVNRTIVVENYNDQPISLRNVRRMK